MVHHGVPAGGQLSSSLLSDVPCCLIGQTQEGTASTALCSAAYNHKVQDHAGGFQLSRLEGMQVVAHTVTVPCAVLCAPVLSRVLTCLSSSCFHVETGVASPLIRTRVLPLKLLFRLAGMGIPMLALFLQLSLLACRLFLQSPFTTKVQVSSRAQDPVLQLKCLGG
jgi:hypothetical protein